MALPVSPDPTDRRGAVLRLLAASPEGLSDAALARALGGPEAGVRPQTVNHLCRRMAAEGELERVGTRPILNRLPPRARRRRRPKAGAPAVEAVPVASAAPTDGPGPAADAAGIAASDGSAAATPAPAAADPSDGTDRDAGAPEAGATTTAAPSPEDTSPDSDAPGPGASTEPTPDPVVATASTSSGSASAAPTCEPPPYDALQAWSRVANVQALVASWLLRRGATLRSATVDGTGPARDLVASMDGDDVHVEVTGWPADGARTHPTTVAGDWFSAAERAAAERRRTHPRARIVVALPDTRRYRSLTEQRAASLAGARAEVWFVDPAGVVHAR